MFSRMPFCPYSLCLVDCLMIDFWKVYYYSGSKTYKLMSLERHAWRWIKKKIVSYVLEWTNCVLWIRMVKVFLIEMDGYAIHNLTQSLNGLLCWELWFVFLLCKMYFITRVHCISPVFRSITGWPPWPTHHTSLTCGSPDQLTKVWPSLPTCWTMPARRSYLKRNR